MGRAVLGARGHFILLQEVNQAVVHPAALASQYRSSGWKKLMSGFT